MNIITQTSEDVYKNAVDVIASQLPQELRAACDRILGDKPTSKETWTLYQTTLTHYQRRGQK